MNTTRYSICMSPIGSVAQVTRHSDPTTLPNKMRHDLSSTGDNHIHTRLFDSAMNQKRQRSMLDVSKTVPVPDCLQGRARDGASPPPPRPATEACESPPQNPTPPNTQTRQGGAPDENSQANHVWTYRGLAIYELSELGCQLKVAAMAW